MSHEEDRGIIDYKRNDMEPCFCGGNMGSVSLGYGRTPYGLFCSTCKTTFLNEITNCGVDGAVEAWNIFRHGGENPFKIRALK